MTCTDQNWFALWDAFNRHKEDQKGNIRVPRKPLRDVLTCHGEAPEGLIAIPARAASESIVVNRTILFDFLRRHGARCVQKAG